MKKKNKTVTMSIEEYRELREKIGTMFEMCDKIFELHDEICRVYEEKVMILKKALHMVE